MRKDSAVMSFSEKKEKLNQYKESSQSGLLKKSEPISISPSELSKQEVIMGGLENSSEERKPVIVESEVL